MAAAAAAAGPASETGTRNGKMDGINVLFESPSRGGL